MTAAPASGGSAAIDSTRRQFLTLVGLGALARPQTLRPATPEGERGRLLPAADAPLQELRRRLFLPDDYTFLNVGSLGPTPDYVLSAAMDAWHRLEEAPVYEGYGPLADAANEVRARAADLLGCDRTEVALTTSTTDGMNLVAEGIDLAEGDRVLTTDQEHEGGSLCWKHYAERRGVVVEQVPLGTNTTDPARIVELFAQRLTPRTRVVSFSQVMYTTGLRLPVARLCTLAEEAGALSVVDGAQAVGAQEIDLHALGCHAWAGSGHKWLLGPKGTGVLYLRRDAQDRIRPSRLQEGLGIYTGATGVPNIPGLIGLGAAIVLLARLGIPRIERHNQALRDELYRRFASTRLQPVGPAPGEAASALLTVELPTGVDSHALGNALRERHRVAVKKLPKPPFNALRFALHAFNTTADCDRLLAALRAELGTDVVG